MKRIFIITLSLLFTLFASSEVYIDTESCTITKNGKTYPASGNVIIVESGDYYDLAVLVASDGDYHDTSIQLVSTGSSTSCGQFTIVEPGNDYDLIITIVDPGSNYDVVVTIDNDFR